MEFMDKPNYKERELTFPKFLEDQFAQYQYSIAYIVKGMRIDVPLGWIYSALSGNIYFGNLIKIVNAFGYDVLLVNAEKDIVQIVPEPKKPKKPQTIIHENAKAPGIKVILFNPKRKKPKKIKTKISKNQNAKRIAIKSAAKQKNFRINQF